MAIHEQHRPSDRLLVVMPTWIGDTVMAMPTLRALRELYPEAHIAALAKKTVLSMLDGCPWVDQVIAIPPKKKKGDHNDSLSDAGSTGGSLVRQLSAEQFDTAVLLPNSFRSALLIRMAGIRRRVGYDRDARGFLLTDRLMARREPGRFVPVPALQYYLGLARYLGAKNPDPTLSLFTCPEDDAKAQVLLGEAGYDSASGGPLIILNPGANYGDAKMWYPDRFAAVAKMCVDRWGASVAVSGAPRERKILDEVIAASDVPLIDLPELGIDLTLLKSVIKQSHLMVTNDTGPRHLAAAFGVRVVTVFGPTDPRWSEIDFPGERIVRVEVFCGPCQKRTCPLDHRCMTQVDPQMVFDEVQALMKDHDEAGISN